jgi:ComF family protein
MLRGVLNAVLPVRCALCGAYLKAEMGICAACDARISSDAVVDGNLLHLGNYHGGLERAAMALKFAKNREVAVPLARKLARGIQVAGWHADALVPLPIHASRARTRTYNQAQVIAEALSKTLEVPVLPALERTRATYTQARLSKREREDNVRGVFKLVRDVAGLEVLLVDDVYTSGATATEASIALIKGGARRVRVVTLARARTALER